MDRDARIMRGTKPFLFTNIRAGVGVERIAEFLVEQGMLRPAS
jgi:urease accessory protein